MELLANQMSKKNLFSVIKEESGEIKMTGGFILNDTPQIRAVLDAIPKDEQFKFVESFRIEPFVKEYYEEE